MKLASQPDASRLIEKALRDVVGQNARLTMQMDTSASTGPQAATGPSFATVAHEAPFSGGNGAGGAGADADDDARWAGVDDRFVAPFEDAGPASFDDAASVPFDASGAPDAIDASVPFDPPYTTRPGGEEDPYAAFAADGDFTAARKPVDDATAQDLTRALSAFGPGVKMSEIETRDEDDG